MDIEEVALREAHAKAQTAFRAMLDAGVYGDQRHPLTRAYTYAEREVDDIIQYAQWEKVKTELDELALGDHFLYATSPGQ